MKKRGLLHLTIFIFLFSLFFVWLTSFLKDREQGVSLTKALPKSKEVRYKVAILADSHLDHQLLTKSLSQAKDLQVNYVIHLGDLSDYGGVENLEASRKILEDSRLSYLVLPGDRDVIKNGLEVKLEDSPFVEIFKDRICSNQLLNEYKIICLVNPYNYLLIDEGDLQNFKNNLKGVNFVISSQPVYNSVGNQYMGFYDDQVLDQAKLINNAIIDENINTVLSADVHFQNHYKDFGIDYYTIGAITTVRNIQRPNFSILTIYTDGTYDLTQIEIR